MQKYKSRLVWRSRTLLKEHGDDKRYADENIEICDSIKRTLKEIPRRYFYNRGATYNQYLNLLERHNTKSIAIQVMRCRGGSQEGCTELVERFLAEQSRFLRRFRKYNNGIKLLNWYRSWWQRRLFTFKNRKQTKRGHYRSIRRLITSWASQTYIRSKSKTIYIRKSPQRQRS